MRRRTIFIGMYILFAFGRERIFFPSLNGTYQKFQEPFLFFFFFFFTEAGLGTSVDTVVLLFAPQIRARRGNGVGNDFTLHFMREEKSLFFLEKTSQSQERCNQDRHNYFLLKCRQGSNHMMNTILTLFFTSQLSFRDVLLMNRRQNRLCRLCTTNSQ